MCSLKQEGIFINLDYLSEEKNYSKITFIFETTDNLVRLFRIFFSKYFSADLNKISTQTIR